MKKYIKSSIVQSPIVPDGWEVLSVIDIDGVDNWETIGKYKYIKNIQGKDCKVYTVISRYRFAEDMYDRYYIVYDAYEATPFLDWNFPYYFPFTHQYRFNDFNDAVSFAEQQTIQG